MEPNPLIDMRDLQGRRDLITPQSSQRAIIVPSKQSILITPTKAKNIERARLLISTVRAFLKKNSAKVRRSLSRNATLNQKTQTKDKIQQRCD
jgi:hypothetical protein